MEPGTKLFSTRDQERKKSLQKKRVGWKTVCPEPKGVGDVATPRGVTEGHRLEIPSYRRSPRDQILPRGI